VDEKQEMNFHHNEEIITMMIKKVLVFIYEEKLVQVKLNILKYEKN
jgi:hypothetical protein